MDNKFNRYYGKIRIILQIDPKTIHEELWNSVLHHIQTWTTRLRQRREDVNDHSRSTRLHYLTLQVKIFN